MQSSTMFLLLLALVACTIADPAPPTGTPCKHIIGLPTCVCQHPDGRIDLRDLANNGSARFDKGISDGDYTYSLNPCNPFSSGDCSNVYVCQLTNTGQGFDVADGDEQIWVSDDGIPYLYYTGPDDRSTRVYLICDTSATGEPTVTTSGDSIKQLSYVFNITSNLVCPGGANTGGGGGGDIAGAVGLSIMFILLGVIIVYFIVGAVIMKVKYDANGLDIIPQRSFWFAVPLLVKDGVLFTFSPCVSAVRNRGYDKA